MISRLLFIYGLILVTLSVAVAMSCTLNSEDLLKMIGEHLAVLFLAIAILPSFGVPNCPLMVIGGGAASLTHGSQLTTLVIVSAVFVNLLLGYWVAAFPLRSFLWKRLKQMRYLNPASPRSTFKTTLLLHLMPGVPLFIQTSFPGVFRLPLWKYLLIAVPIQTVYTVAIVLTSGGVLSVIPTRLGALILFSLIILTVLKMCFLAHRRLSDPSIEARDTGLTASGSPID